MILKKIFLTVSTLGAWWSLINQFSTFSHVGGYSDPEKNFI